MVRVIQLLPADLPGDDEFKAAPDGRERRYRDSAGFRGAPWRFHGDAVSARSVLDLGLVDGTNSLWHQENPVLLGLLEDQTADAIPGDEPDFVPRDRPDDEESRNERDREPRQTGERAQPHAGTSRPTIRLGSGPTIRLGSGPTIRLGSGPTIFPGVIRQSGLARNRPHSALCLRARSVPARSGHVLSLHDVLRH